MHAACMHAWRLHAQTRPRIPTHMANKPNKRKCKPTASHPKHGVNGTTLKTRWEGVVAVLHAVSRCSRVERGQMVQGLGLGFRVYDIKVEDLLLGGFGNSIKGIYDFLFGA